jgi:hypothetical protein
MSEGAIVGTPRMRGVEFLPRSNSVPLLEKEGGEEGVEDCSRCIESRPPPAHFPHISSDAYNCTPCNVPICADLHLDLKMAPAGVIFGCVCDHLFISAFPSACSPSPPSACRFCSLGAGASTCEQPNLLIGRASLLLELTRSILAPSSALQCDRFLRESRPNEVAISQPLMHRFSLRRRVSRSTLTGNLPLV